MFRGEASAGQQAIWLGTVMLASRRLHGAIAAFALGTDEPLIEDRLWRRVLAGLHQEPFMHLHDPEALRCFG